MIAKGSYFPDAGPDEVSAVNPQLKANTNCLQSVTGEEDLNSRVPLVWTGYINDIGTTEKATSCSRAD